MVLPQQQILKGKSMIKAVLIDIDDTLLDFGKCSRWAVLKTAGEQGVDLPEGWYGVFRNITDRLWNELEDGKITHADIFGQRWRMIFAVLGVNADPDAFEAGFLKNLSDSTERVDGAEDILRYLSSRYRVYTASNGPLGQQINRMKLSGLDRYICGQFVSEELGASKPQLEFYDRVFERLSPITPQETAAIGDSMRVDMSGAKKYGLMTCWFRKNGGDAEGLDCADYTVDSLEEIKGIL